MAETTPLFMDISNAYSGDELGLPYKDIVREGVVRGGMAVTVTAPVSMAVSIAAGAAWVEGDTSAVQPTYRIYNDAAVSRSISADASNPRKVLVVAQITDETFSGTGRNWAIVAIHGTPAASPVVPTLPPSAIPLAEVHVNAAATSIVAGNITDRRPIAGSRLTPYASPISAGPPASPSDGDIWIATGVDPNGENWTFRYNALSASAYKWEFIGGPEVARYGTATNSVSSTTATDVGGIANMNFPRAGDYLVHATAIAGTNSGTVGLRLYYQLSIAGSGAAAVMMSSNKATSNDASDVHFNIWYRANGVAASALLKTQFYTADTSYTMYISPKILSMIPFRVS